MISVFLSIFKLFYGCLCAYLSMNVIVRPVSQQKRSIESDEKKPLDAEGAGNKANKAMEQTCPHWQKSISIADIDEPTEHRTEICKYQYNSACEPSMEI